MPIDEWEDYLKDFYAKVDTNGDGYIDISESRAFVLEALKMWEEVYGDVKVTQEHLSDAELVQ